MKKGRAAKIDGPLPALLIIVSLAAGTGITYWLGSASQHPAAKSSTSVSPKARTDDVQTAPAVLTTGPSLQRRQADNETFSPDYDDWNSEALADSAKHQMERILEVLQEPLSPKSSQLVDLVSPDFAGEPLRPDRLRHVAGDDYYSVQRGLDRSSGSEDGKRLGPQGMANLLCDFVKPLLPCENIKSHIKVYGLSVAGDTVATTVDIETSGQHEGRSVQQNATWICHWTRNEGQLRLDSIFGTDYEEVEGTAKDKTWFVDCTEAALANNSSFRQQIVYGLNHWMRRIERVHRMQVYARTGLAVGDVDGDGLDDVYLCQPAGLPNRLFVQMADGTTTDRSQDSGTDWLDESHGALLVDFDNDGDQDLAVACTAGVIVMENDSTGRFRVKTRLEMERSVESLSAVDYDNDGDLDVYVCVYRADPEESHEGAAAEFLYHDANDGGVNRLFSNEILKSNEDEWRFRDVTRQCGLDQSNRRWSLAASWEDFDNDGDQDLYVANDYGQNCLYRNDDGQFVNVASEMGVVDFGSGMSVSWGDANNDGWMDLYVGNMFSAAGNRISTQPDFMARADDATRKLYQRFAKGNSLFENQAGERFVEVGDEAGVEMARWAWSSLFVDVNNDGWEDMLVANGFITADDERDL